MKYHVELKNKIIKKKLSKREKLVILKREVPVKKMIEVCDKIISSYIYLCLFYICL